MKKKTFKEFNEMFFINKKTGYKFNKKIFQVWLALVLILFGVIMLNYGDIEYKTYTCNEMKCENPLYNISDQNMTFDDMYFYRGETIESPPKPQLINNFIPIVLMGLICAFAINHFFNEMEAKDE